MRPDITLVHRTVFRVKTLVLLLVLFAFPVNADQLAIKTYTSANGLASSAITHVARDSQGFMWFSNREGLSRFDGTEFVNFILPDTAASQTFRFFLETRDGWIWLATDGGLFRARRSEVADVRPSERTEGRERVLSAKRVWGGHTNMLFEDSRGTLWIGGSKLHRVDERDGDEISITTIETPHTPRPQVVWIDEASDGSLWLSQVDGPARLLPDGRQMFYPIARSASNDEVYMIDVAADGRVWFGHAEGLFVFLPETIEEIGDLATGTKEFNSTKVVELGSNGTVEMPLHSGELLQMKFASATALFQQDGRFSVALGNSLFVFDGSAYQRIGGRDVLAGTTRSIAVDEQNGLWLGSTGGAIRFIQDGFVSYGSDDGLTDPQISSIFESPNGELLIAHGLWRVSRLTEKGFESTVLNVPSDTRYSWTSSSVTIDPAGNLYALGRQGLFRFPKTGDLSDFGTQRPDEFPGLRGHPFYRAFTARDGKVWFSLRGNAPENGLVRFDHATGAFENMAALPGYPTGKAAAAFAEDRGGNIWLGFYGTGGVARFSGDSFTQIALRDPEVRGTMAMLVDRLGRLWIGTTSHGIIRIKDPANVDLIETEYIGETQGLASNNVRAIVDDEAGNVYVGTVRGVDRVSIESDAIRHYSTDDGLAADFINAAFRDSRGALWFGTPNGVSRLTPRSNETSAPPRIFINDLQIAGESYGISEFGQTAVRDIELAASQNNLQISAVGVGTNLLYEYKLEGSGTAEWSRPDSLRTFNFASLAPGKYTLQVRAVSGAGIRSSTPATVSFVINPPFYRSWWFIALSALIVIGSVVVLDRYRVSKTRQVQSAYDDLRKSEAVREQAEAALEKSRADRLAELERVRSRIATDLHDDIGSSLTQIAVLTQAAHNEVQQRGVSMTTPLQRISDVSIELVNAMSDIVWAINPRRDNLRDLVQRMRRFAADVFTSSAIRFEFHAPSADNKLAIGANIRREVFAIYKEAVTNVMKHSGAKSAKIDLTIAGEILSIAVADDGRGFDPDALLHMSQAPESGGGNGLVNIRRRTAELGGECEIVSSPGNGTMIRISISLTSTSHAAGESEDLNDLDLPRNGNE